MPDQFFRPTRGQSPSFTTSTRTHRHRPDKLNERGPTRAATTRKFNPTVHKSSRDRVNIDDSELKKRWPTGSLRPRVQVFRNDGGLLKDTGTTMIYSLQQLLDFAARVLKMAGGGARRLFTTDGEEITKLSEIQAPMMDIVVSGGEDFKQRDAPEPEPFFTRPSPRKWKPYTVGAMQHPTPSDKKLLDLLPGAVSPKEWGNPRAIETPLDQPRKRPRVFIFRNDGGHSLECVATLVYTFPALLEEATQVLSLNRAARHLHTLDGSEINSVDHIVYDMKLVVSCGEEFKERSPDLFQASHNNTVARE